MPLPTTFAGVSARGEGLFTSVVSLGGSYFVATITQGNTGSDLLNWKNPASKPLVVDNLGNYWIVFNDSNTASSTNLQSVIIKFDNNGTLLFQKNISTAQVYLSSLATDSSGNIYASVSSGTNGGVMKITNAGAISWTKGQHPTAGGGAFGASVAIDSSNNVYSGLGIMDNNITGILVPKIYKLDSSGGTLITDGSSWYRAVALSSNGTYLRGMITDTSNNVYIAGSYPFNGSSNYYLIAKVNSSLTVSWAYYLAASGDGKFYNVGLDSTGNVYAAGSVDTTTPVITKFNNSGTKQWFYSVTGITTPSEITSLTTDLAGNSYVCGYSNNGNTTGGTFIIKIDTSGAIVWQRKITMYGTSGSNVNTKPQGIYLDSFNNFYVIGNFTSSNGSINVWTVKLPTDGTKTGTYSVGGFTFAYASITTYSLTSSSPSVGSAVDNGNPGATSTNSYASVSSSYTEATTLIP